MSTPQINSGHAKIGDAKIYYQLAGGMKRRLVLARALLHNPDIILLDKPTLGVDVHCKHVLWVHIKELKESGKTFIVTTNDILEAEVLFERLVIINPASICGPPSQPYCEFPLVS